MAEIRIWVITDGRVGNENQALGLASAVARRAPTAIDITIDVKRISPKRGFSLAPPRLWDLLGAQVDGWPFTALETGADTIGPPYPDIAIGAGRRSAPIVSALKRLSGGTLRAVQILNPQMPLSRFDLVVTPRHDRLNGSNVLLTLGALHRLTSERLAEADPRIARLRKPFAAVLVGGPSRSARFSDNDFDALIASLETLATDGVGLAATTSRRTPATWSERLQTALERTGGWMWDGASPNPLWPMIGAASAIIVTADSVNMTSEACFTGAPVYVAPISRIARKLGRFHDALRVGGYERPLADLLAAPDRRQAINDWRPLRLDETARAADAVLALVSPQG